MPEAEAQVRRDRIGLVILRLYISGKDMQC